MSIRVLLADDHPLFRKGLRGVLEEASDITVVAEAANGEDALTMIREQRPDVVVLDLDMPGRDGIEVAGVLRDEKLPVRAVLLTAHRSEALVNRALDSGVSGYVLKDGALTEIVDCVRAVHAGRPWVSAQLATVLLTRRDKAEHLSGDHPGLGSLTATERRVLTLVARGSTSREIGEELFISVRTVEHHRANIALKLGLRGSNALVKFAVAHRSELS
jgi:two-component system, NarL family, response regulator DegU